MAKRQNVKKAKTGNESHPYDKIFKENLDAVTPTFIKKVLHIDAIEIIDIPVKLQRTKEREPDFLKKD